MKPASASAAFKAVEATRVQEMLTNQPIANGTAFALVARP
jgi:hypothetical protein